MSALGSGGLFLRLSAGLLVDELFNLGGDSLPALTGVGSPETAGNLDLILHTIPPFVGFYVLVCRNMMPECPENRELWHLLPGGFP